MPRVIPLEAAADMMLSGRPLPAAQAKELGLVDQVVKGDVTEGAIAYAREARRRRQGTAQDARAAGRGAEKVAEMLDGQARTGRQDHAQPPVADQAARRRAGRGRKAVRRRIGGRKQPVSAEPDRRRPRRARCGICSSPSARCAKFPVLLPSVTPRPSRADRHRRRRHHGRRHRDGFANAGIPVTLVDATQAGARPRPRARSARTTSARFRAAASLPIRWKRA